MLTLAALVKSFRHSDVARLLRSLEAAGLPLPAPLRPALRARPVAVLALAARRAAELAYGPRPELHDLADALLAHQRPDGGFDSRVDARVDADASPVHHAPVEADPLTTAAAVVALDRLADSLPAVHTGPLETAADRAADALRRIAPRLFDAVRDARATAAATPVAALLAFLLSESPRRAGLLTPEQVRGLEAACTHAADPALTQLWQMARLGLPNDADPTPESCFSSNPVDRLPAAPP